MPVHDLLAGHGRLQQCGCCLGQNHAGTGVKHAPHPRDNAAPVFDGQILLAKAMQKANSLHPKKHQPVLAAFSCQGVVGRVLLTTSTT